MKVFITGGTTGIGLALAKEYLDSGHTVGICGRDLSKLPDDFTNKYPTLKSYAVDVTDRELVIKTVQDFAQGELDLLIANAGRSVGSKTKKPDFDASRDVLNINIFGVLNSFEAALDIMLEKGKGHIVAVGSVAGMVGLPGASSYSASKAAVIKLCESYSLDLKKWNIDVSCVCPGFIDTPLTRKNDHSMPWLMDADRAAKMIKKALENKKSLYVFPWQMRSVMFILERLPRFLYRKMMGMKFANYSKDI